MNRLPDQAEEASGANTLSPGELLIEAVYQNGIFKPLVPLHLSPGTPLRIRVASVREGAILSDVGRPSGRRSPQASTPKGTNMAELSHDDLTPPPDMRPQDVQPPEATPAAGRPPIGIIVIGVVLLAILGLILFRSLRGSKGAPDGGGGSNQTAQQLVGGQPLATPAMANSQLPAPELVSEIKLPGTGDKPPKPRDVAVDDQGNIYIVFDHDGTIRKVDPKGNVVASWGNNTSGSEPVFKELFALAVDAKNNTVFALDANVATLLRFDLQGAPKGDPITGLGYYPRGVTLGANNELLVADTGGQRVLRVNANDGTIIGELGKPAPGSTDSSEPIDAETVKNGEIFVFDARNNRIQHFKPDGQLIKQWSAPNNVAARDSGHLAIDRQDRLYFAGVDKREITVFNPAGEILAVWPQDSGEPPVGIYVDAQDFMYVTYPESGTVRKFK
ncbi:MAG TPA: antitoxin AF2212-like protein, partial [Pyrinomonadaceae bacterium]|nr:antitoxin AF2212-like protein [Pyrinomonadaceae bacterium]